MNPAGSTPAAPLPAAPVTRGGDGFTVASFNLHWGRAGKAQRFAPFDVVEACRRLDADVLVLQESWAPDGAPAQHDEVAAALGLDVVEVRPLARSWFDDRPRLVHRRRPRGRHGTGWWCLVLLSRLPVKESATVRLPALRLDPVERCVLRARLAVGDRTVTVCGTHLPHLEAGVALLAPAVRAALPPPDEPAVLAGDMNMWGWCIAAMVGGGWRRAVRGATYPAHRPHSQIDHLLLTAGVAVRESGVMPLVASDHRPIRARLALVDR